MHSGTQRARTRPSVKLLTCLVDWALTGLSTRDFTLPARGHQRPAAAQAPRGGGKSPRKDCLIACAAEKLTDCVSPPATTSGGQPVAPPRATSNGLQITGWTTVPGLSLAVTVYSHKFRGPATSSPVRTCLEPFIRAPGTCNCHTLTDSV